MHAGAAGSVGADGRIDARDVHKEKPQSSTRDHR